MPHVARRAGLSHIGRPIGHLAEKRGYLPCVESNAPLLEASTIRHACSEPDPIPLCINGRHWGADTHPKVSDCDGAGCCESFAPVRYLQVRFASPGRSKG